ncbi:hypothetical protein V2A60_008746 [Cordyceps javanica]
MGKQEAAAPLEDLATNRPVKRLPGKKAPKRRQFTRNDSETWHRPQATNVARHHTLVDVGLAVIVGGIAFLIFMSYASTQTSHERPKSHWKLARSEVAVCEVSRGLGCF